jgi:hypothetical protein
MSKTRAFVLVLGALVIGAVAGGWGTFQSSHRIAIISFTDTMAAQTSAAVRTLEDKGDYAGANPEDQDEYKAEDVFWVPKEGRWSHLQARCQAAHHRQDRGRGHGRHRAGQPAPQGHPAKDYARPGLDKHRLGELIDLIGTIGLGDRENLSRTPGPHRPTPRTHPATPEPRPGSVGQRSEAADVALDSACSFSRSARYVMRNLPPRAADSLHSADDPRAEHGFLHSTHTCAPITMHNKENVT